MNKDGDEIQISGDYQFKAINSNSKIQRFWHENKFNTIDFFLAPKISDTVLDVGCGSGVISNYLASKAKFVYGIDGNKYAIDFAKTNSKKDNICYMNALVDSNLNIDPTIDKIYCLELIEHIYFSQSVEMLNNFNRVLKSDGFVLITTPNYRSFWPIIEFVMDTFGLAPKMRKLQHIEQYNRYKIFKLAAAAHFEIISYHTINFLAPWIAFFSYNFAAKINHSEFKLNRMGSTCVFVLQKKNDFDLLSK
jgi:2-polyprenyl-3-methyl-5-hydroxy-6-metoxy-1,4-benzoquinol methylase